MTLNGKWGNALRFRVLPFRNDDHGGAAALATGTTFGWGFFFIGGQCTLGERSGTRTKMPIWRLDPIHPDDHHWRASTYTGPLSVRAADEIKARELAASAFRIGAETSAARDVPRPPWLFPWLVTCTRIEDSEFEEDGPDTVLGLETSSKRPF